MQLDVVKGQAKIFDLFDKAIKNNKLSHAYLFDSNNNSNSLDVVLQHLTALKSPLDKKHTFKQY